MFSRNFAFPHPRRVAEERIGVQFVIAKILERAAVVFVRSGLERHHRYTASRLAVFRGKRVVQDLHLFRGFCRRVDRRPVRTGPGIASLRNIDGEAVHDNLVCDSP